MPAWGWVLIGLGVLAAIAAGTYLFFALFASGLSDH